MPRPLPRVELPFPACLGRRPGPGRRREASQGRSFPGGASGRAMAALDGGLGELVAGRGLGLAGASGRGRPGLWAAPRSFGRLHDDAGLAAPGGGGLAPSLPVRGGPRASSPCRRRKHKMDDDDDGEEPAGCPASKKRPADTGLSPPTPAVQPWMLPAEPCLSRLPGPPEALDSPCEDMEQVMGEQQQQQQQQCEAARRKLQEIEDSITDEDEDEGGLVEGPLGNLPTLVLSDTLKTGLKRDYAGDLTKKIIESMSRPSMELVIWKPLPEFLTKKAKSVSAKNYKPMAEKGPAKPATLEAAFSLQTEKFSDPQQTEMPSAFYSAVEPAGYSEEEMEL